MFESAITDLNGEKGKRNSQLDERDEALATRFYYHGNLLRRNYEDCLIELNKEFFISPNVIIQRLSLKRDFLKQLVSEKPGPKELSRKYGFFNWGVMRMG